MATARIIRIADCQAVMLPEEFWFERDEVLIRRLGKGVVLVPEEDPWDTLIRSLDMFSDDYMDDRQQPEQPDRRGL